MLNLHFACIEKLGESCRMYLDTIFYAIIFRNNLNVTQRNWTTPNRVARNDLAGGTPEEQLGDPFVYRRSVVVQAPGNQCHLLLSLPMDKQLLALT